MIVYTYSEARQNLSTLLDDANREGEVILKRRDGQAFVVKPENKNGSPLDVKGINLNLTRSEILKSIRDSRRK